MPQVSEVLWEFRGQYCYWCPGCKHAHCISVKHPAPERPRWGFDGNVERPTFTPSIREYWPARPDLGEPERTRCHHFVKAGEIEFLSDSGAHEVRGKVPMVPLPQDYGWPGKED